jgi:hypothetical protein
MHSSPVTASSAELIKSKSTNKLNICGIQSLGQPVSPLPRDCPGFYRDTCITGIYIQKGWLWHQSLQNSMLLWRIFSGKDSRSDCIAGPIIPGISPMEDCTAATS